jgi:hypothetical protein
MGKERKKERKEEVERKNTCGYMKARMMEGVAYTQHKIPCEPHAEC